MTCEAGVFRLLLRTLKFLKRVRMKKSVAGSVDSKGYHCQWAVGNSVGRQSNGPFVRSMAQPKHLVHKEHKKVIELPLNHQVVKGTPKWQAAKGYDSCYDGRVTPIRGLPLKPSFARKPTELSTVIKEGMEVQVCDTKTSQELAFSSASSDRAEVVNEAHLLQDVRFGSIGECEVHSAQDELMRMMDKSDTGSFGSEDVSSNGSGDYTTDPLDNYVVCPTLVNASSLTDKQKSIFAAFKHS